MNKRILTLLVSIGFCMPYVFLAMWCDLEFGSMLFYGIMIVVLIFLTRISFKLNNFSIQLVGNILSFISSYFFISLQEGERWGWYFKPLSAMGLLKVVTLIIVISQGMSWIVYRRNRRNRRDLSKYKVD